MSKHVRTISSNCPLPLLALYPLPNADKRDMIATTITLLKEGVMPASNRGQMQL